MKVLICKSIHIHVLQLDKKKVFISCNPAYFIFFTAMSSFNAIDKTIKQLMIIMQNIFSTYSHTINLFGNKQQTKKYILSTNPDKLQEMNIFFSIEALFWKIDLLIHWIVKINDLVLHTITCTIWTHMLIVVGRLKNTMCLL